MDADLDLLLTSVFVTADDLPPQRQNNAARSPSDRRFLAVAGNRLDHLFRGCRSSRVLQTPPQLADTLEWLLGIFATKAPVR